MKNGLKPSVCAGCVGYDRYTAQKVVIGKKVTKQTNPNANKWLYF